MIRKWIRNHTNNTQKIEKKTHYMVPTCEKDKQREVSKTLFEINMKYKERKLSKVERGCHDRD